MGKVLLYYTNKVILILSFYPLSVLERQLDKFPTLYLETVINREERLVLTGIAILHTNFIHLCI